MALEQKQDPSKGYDPGFLRQLDRDTAHIIAARGIKIVHNGGALNPRGLAAAVEEKLASYGVSSLTVAYVEGDNVMGQLESLRRPNQTPHLDVHGRQLSDIEAPIISANAYIGMGGIVAALEAGADIVICGRCCDASPVMGECLLGLDPSQSIQMLTTAKVPRLGGMAGSRRSGMCWHSLSSPDVCWPLLPPAGCRITDFFRHPRVRLLRHRRQFLRLQVNQKQLGSGVSCRRDRV